MTNKSVSVYINAYNAENFIKETVDSVLGQTYQNINLVVINDCSTDRTLEILNSIDDDRLTVYSLPKNMHIANALNEGLKYMDGDYIAHCDADDIWEKDKIEQQIDFLEDHPEYGACFTWLTLIDGSGAPYTERYPVDFSIENAPQSKLINMFCNTSNHFHHSSFFARREIIKKVGEYDYSLPTLHDFDYWMRLLTVTPVYIIQKPLMRYRLHSANNSQMDATKTDSHDSEYLRVINKCISLCPDDLFLEAFADDLFFKSKHTKEETAIEKALILAKIRTPLYYNPVLSVEALSNLINDPVYRKIMIEKFDFTPKKLRDLRMTRQYHNQKVEDGLNAQIVKLQGKIFELNDDLTQAKARISLIENGLSWRLTKPLRVMSTAMRKTAAKHPRFGRAVIYTKSFIKGGPGAVKQKKIDLRASTPVDLEIPNTISKQRRAEEENYTFEKDVKISILVPLYNTPQVFLEEMIDSVVNQTYKNWELCLADGSTDDFAFVGEYCKKIAENDSRIKYEKLTENKGISENTNHCLSMATGEYIALFDHDDYLHPSALFEVMKRICDGADFIYTDEVTFLGDDFKKLITCHLKPDFAPDNLLANNYICHFSVFKSDLASSEKLFRTKYDGSQDHDLILRLTGAAKKIEHIPQVLYFWRSHKNSVSMDINSKKYAIDAGINAVHDYLEAKGLPCTVESSPAFPTIYRIKYKLNGTPKVSIIIPNKNHYEDLSRCLNSIFELSTYQNFEIIIVENQSNEQQIKDYYNALCSNPRIKLLSYDKQFNYSAINNFAVANSTGDYILFLNNDTKVISPDWIEELLMFAQREDVGAVGAKLYFEDKTIQHGGIILGLGSDRIAGHSHFGCAGDNCGYMGKLYYAQDVSAVTAACMMVKKDVFLKVGGFSEELAVAYNDVDFCLKLRREGRLNIFNPFCELYHFESASRGSDKTPENKARFSAEKAIFLQTWGKTIENGDPYYNPNFSLDVSYEIKLLPE